MRYSSRVFITLLFCITGKLHAAQSAIDDQFLASMINKVKHSSGLASGTAIAVVKDDKVIYEGYFGFKNIATQSPVDRNTIFYIASATKPLTALNFLLDAEQHPQLENTTIAKMFPQFSIASRRNVNAKDLLTHTASINNLPLVLATAYSGEHTPDSLHDIVIKLSTASSETVGEFKYTNVGYNIYSVYSDKLFATPWQKKLLNQVFEPAGMRSTTAIRSTIVGQDNIAKSYSLPEPNNNQALYLEKQDSTLHAAGGVYTTAKDMSTFLLAQLNHGVVDEKQVYPASVIDKSHVQQVTTDTSYGDFNRKGYAWGWYTGEYKSSLMLHHFGGFAGVHSHLSFMPEQKLGLVVLNGEDFLSARLTGLVADYVYGALLGDTDSEARISKKVDELLTKLETVDEMITREHDKIAAREWQLSLPGQSYTGNYIHPLLGKISIQLNDQQRFLVRWGVMHSDSSGMDKKDQIRVELDPTNGTVIAFDVEDTVKSLRYAGVEFTKAEGRDDLPAAVATGKAAKKSTPHK